MKATEDTIKKKKERNMSPNNVILEDRECLEDLMEEMFGKPFGVISKVSNPNKSKQIVNSIDCDKNNTN